MIRWKVRKAANGHWWAHEPTCDNRIWIMCALFNRCTNCGTFRKAYAYAETMASADRRIVGKFRLSA